MQRIPEPELMNEWTQAEAYASADFSEAHNRIVQAFDIYFPGIELSGEVLDLGCGPGDITFRFAARFPRCTLTGVDGSSAMIKLANDRKARELGVEDRMNFIEGSIPHASIPDVPYEAIISNSLLHHLHRPEILWETIIKCASTGTNIFLADLFRPMSQGDAQRMVDKYAAGEPAILQRDFYNSLLAAFAPNEVEEQIASANLDELSVHVISDRHLLVHGIKA